MPTRAAPSSRSGRVPLWLGRPHTGRPEALGVLPPGAVLSQRWREPARTPQGLSSGEDSPGVSCTVSLVAHQDCGSNCPRWNLLVNSLCIASLLCFTCPRPSRTFWGLLLNQLFPFSSSPRDLPLRQWRISLSLNEVVFTQFCEVDRNSFSIFIVGTRD